MYFRPFPRSAALLAAAALGLAACSDADPADPLGDGEARLNLLLTDAPGEVEAAWLQIDRVYLQGQEGPVDLLDEPTDLIEITELVGTSLLLADDVDVEPGLYSQLRFVIGAGVLESKAGEVYTMGGAIHPDGFEATGELQCPSCAQSGLKVILPGDELPVDDGETTVVLDFDVSQSFGHRAGNSGRWVMRPTMHGSWVEGPPALGPVLAGTVRLAEGVVFPACPAGVDRDLADFVPLVTSTTLTGEGAEFLTLSGTTGADGAFLIGPLLDDLWTLSYLPVIEVDGAELHFVAEPTVTEFTIAGVDFTGVEFVISSVACVD